MLKNLCQAKQDYYRPQRSCGKVIFSQACVKNSVQREGGVSQHSLGQRPPLPSACWDTPPGQTPPTPGRHHPLPLADTPLGRPPQADPPGRHPPPGADGYCSGRYASYWNAFLFFFIKM